MKLVLIILVSLILLVSGCVTLKEKSPTAAEKPKVTQSPLKSPLSTQQKTQESSQEPASQESISMPSPQQEPPIETYDSYPTITGSLSPSNPSLGGVFKLTIKSDDLEGIKKISWTSSKPLSGSSSDSFDCRLQKTCSYTWDFISTEEGANQFTVITVDSSGKEGKFTLDLNVGPASPKKSPSPTPSSSAQTSTSPQSTASSSSVSCSSNSDCGYKKICTGGGCQAVACTSDSHCTGCKRCSSNRCVSCGSGPYGCYC